MDEDKKTFDEFLEDVALDPRVLENLREVRDILEEEKELGKDEALSFLMGFLASGFNELDTLLAVLETIKLSYLLPMIQPMVLASNMVEDAPTDRTLKPV